MQRSMRSQPLDDALSLWLVVTSQMNMPTNEAGVVIFKLWKRLYGSSGLPVGFPPAILWRHLIYTNLVLVKVLLIVRNVMREHNAGNKHIWRTALSSYIPYTGKRLGDMDEIMSRDAFHERSSSFFVSERSFRMWSAWKFYCLYLFGFVIWPAWCCADAF